MASPGVFESSVGCVSLPGGYTLMCLIFRTVGGDTLLHHICIHTAQIRSTLPPSMEMHYEYWEDLNHHFGY